MIFYFSATGNSRYVAERLAKALHDDTTVDLAYYLRSGEALPPFEAADGERVGFVFPVHSWGMPKGLRQLVETIRINGYKRGDNYCYMVCTCGDDAGLTAKQWQKSVSRCGLHGDAAYSVFMPNTYVLLPGFDVDSPEATKRKLEASVGKVEEISGSILVGKKGDFTHHGSFSRLKSDVVYPVFMALMTDRPFRCDSSKCVACGKCAKVCPTGNIELRGGIPEWRNHRCINCVACYHYCPAGAISYGKMTHGKGHYVLPSKF